MTPPLSSNNLLSTLCAQEFMPYIGQYCQVSADGYVFSLMIETVAEHANLRQAHMLRAPFTVIFKGELEPHFEYGLLALEMATGWSLPSIYLERTMPSIGADPGYAYYQSVFN